MASTPLSPYRLSAHDKKLLVKLRQLMGIDTGTIDPAKMTEAQVVRIAIRELARTKGVA